MAGEFDFPFEQYTEELQSLSADQLKLHIVHAQNLLEVSYLRQEIEGRMDAFGKDPLLVYLHNLVVAQEAYYLARSMNASYQEADDIKSFFLWEQQMAEPDKSGE